MNRLDKRGSRGLFVGRHIAPAAGSAQENTLYSRIDNILSGVATNNQPGVAALVKKDGKVFFSKGYGLRKWVLPKKSIRERIFASPRSPSSLPPWESCCWFMTASFATTNRSPRFSRISQLTGNPSRFEIS